MSSKRTMPRDDAAAQRSRQQPVQEYRPAGESPARGGVQQANGTDSRLSAAPSAANVHNSSARGRSHCNAHHEEHTHGVTTPSRRTEGGETSSHGGQNTTNHALQPSDAAPALLLPPRDPHPPRNSLLFRPPSPYIPRPPMPMQQAPSDMCHVGKPSPLEMFAGMNSLPQLFAPVKEDVPPELCRR